MSKFFIRLYITQPQLLISYRPWLPFFSPAALSCLQLQPHCAMYHLHSLPLVTLLPGATPSPHHLPPLIALPKCYSVFETQHRHHLLKRLCQVSFIPAQPPSWDRGLHLAPTPLSCYTHSDSHLIMSLSSDSSSRVRALFYLFPHPQMLVKSLKKNRRTPQMSHG